jgi:hypothetical protein
VQVTSSSRSGTTSGVAAILVVLTFVVVWWLLSGNGPQGPDGNADRYAVPEEDATAPAGDGEAGRDSGADDGTGAPARSGRVGVESFVALDGRRIALNYSTGLAACVGELDTPRVVESDVSVTVTLTLVPPADPPEVCAQVAEPHTVVVGLDVPLGDRSVLDGSSGRLVRVEPAARAYDPAVLPE